MIDLISRKDWNARPPKGGYSTMPSGVKGVKVHYTGGRVDPAILANHSLCGKAIRGIQNGHMDGNNWTDIGYSFAACPHRKVFVLRGLHNVPAANGAGLNSGHYAVLGLVGNSGLVVPPPGMLHGIRDAIEYIRANGPAGKEVKGHRDGYATDCPGRELYSWILSGAPRPSEEIDIVTELPVLAKGASNFDVKTLRALIFARGYLDENPEDLELWLESLIFDDVLESIVKNFQTFTGLDPDGVVGPKTWRKLLRLKD